MLVLDANIVIRAVLGSRVLDLLRKYAVCVEFVAPDTAFEEVHKHLPEVLAKRNVAIAPAMEALELVARLVQTLEREFYLPYESVAKQRISRRDVDDWPVLACALALGCPIWTEDNDFFGCGVATWTSDRVELYLKTLSKP